jgi:soluble lytic murein transglycosylase-like protein
MMVAAVLAADRVWAAQSDFLDLTPLVYAIADVESGGDPNAVGEAGERGLMQIMPETWHDTTQRAFGETVDFSRAFEPMLNREIGRAHLAHLAEQLRRRGYGGDDRFMGLLVAAYHRGLKYIASHKYSLALMSDETQAYVKRVVNTRAIYVQQSRAIFARVVSRLNRAMHVTRQTIGM